MVEIKMHIKNVIMTFLLSLMVMVLINVFDGFDLNGFKSDFNEKKICL